MVDLNSCDSGPPSAHTIVARACSPRGDLVLRRRGRDGVLELRVNGVFVMDSKETSTERAIASLALDRPLASSGRPTADGWRVLIGGLGLGYTLAALVKNPAVGNVTVAEIEPALIEWHRAGLVPETADLIDSPGVVLVAQDVRTVLRAQRAGSLDTVVLDVDNGPGYLVYDENAALYRPGFLEECRKALTQNGSLVVWSADHAADFERTLNEVFGCVFHQEIPVALGRIDRYHAYTAIKTPCRADLEIAP